MTTAVAIYKITNLVNSKQYIGISTHLNARWLIHKKAKGSCPALHASIKKYGIDNFIFEHFANALSVENAKLLERHLIVEHNTQSPNGYNLTMGGEGLYGFEHLQIIKSKISESKKGKPSNRKGAKLSAEQIKKMSEFMKGKPSKRKGIKGQIAWNKGLKGAQVAWNKGISGVVKWSDEDKLKHSAKIKETWLKRKGLSCPQQLSQ